MRWFRGILASAVVLTLVVLVPAMNAPAASASLAYREPVTPYADLPSQQEKVFASDYDEWTRNKYGADGVRELDTAYPHGSSGDLEKTRRAKEYLNEKGYPQPGKVSEERTRTATKNGTTTAKVSKPVTKPGIISRGIGGLTLIDGLLSGFAIGSLGLEVYANVTGDNPLPSTCGTGWQDVTSFLYPSLAAECVVIYNEGQINADVNAIGAGFTAQAIRHFGPGKQGSSNWDSAWLRMVSVTGNSYSDQLPSVTMNFDSSITGELAASDYWFLGLSTAANLQRFNIKDGVWKNWGGIGLATAKNGEVRSAQTTPQIGNSLDYVNATTVGTAHQGWRLHFEGGTREAPIDVYWYPEGSPNRPEGTNGDPERQLACSLTWPDGSVTEVAGATYLESQGYPISSGGQACNEAAKSRPGELPVKTTIKSTNPDNDEETVLTEQDMPEYTPEEEASINDKTGRGLVLLKGTVSCLTWEVDCSGWWEETNFGKKTDTEYSCTYGGLPVDLAQCFVYRATFENPDVNDTPVISDPVTGEDIQWNPTERNENSTDPSTGPSPGGECMAQWGSAPNPVEWVLYPIKCAMVWAFVPRTQVVETAFKSSSSKWDKTMPGQIAKITTTAFIVPEVEGCEGLHIHIPLGGIQPGWVDVDWNVLNACTGPGATAAQWSRLIGSAILIYMTALGIVRRASATVNAPGLGSGSAA